MKEIVEALKKRISENENSMLVTVVAGRGSIRSEEHTSELQSH